MTDIITTTTTPVGDCERVRLAEAARKREAIELAQRFRQAIQEANVDTVNAMMGERKGTLRRALDAHDELCYLLPLAYEKLGEELGKVVFAFATKRHNWSDMGDLVNALMRTSLTPLQSLVDEAVHRYMALYQSCADWFADVAESDDPDYPPHNMWVYMEQAAADGNEAAVNCFYPLAILDMDGAVAKGLGWRYQLRMDRVAAMDDSVRERILAAMPAAERETLVPAYEAYVAEKAAKMQAILADFEAAYASSAESEEGSDELYQLLRMFFVGHRMSDHADE